jgi:pyruvate/2-oxoglutarate dehydrogenase complex dihydrolipoamide acyltransferase (E2) component
MSDPKAVPSAARLEFIRMAIGEDVPRGYEAELLAALAAAQAERDSAEKDKRLLAAQASAAMTKACSLGRELNDAKVELAAAQARIALVRGVIAEDARLSKSTGIPSDGSILISDVEAALDGYDGDIYSMIGAPAVPVPADPEETSQPAPWREGYEAYKRAVPGSQPNPYPQWSEERRQWAQGWLSAFHESPQYKAARGK